MKDLLIIGARGFGREIYSLAQNSIGYLSEFSIKGFLDDDPKALFEKPGYPAIINSVENYSPQPNDVFICALGNPTWQKYYSDIILSRGGLFINLIHKTAIIGQNSIIGYGCIFKNGVSVSCDCILGNFVSLQPRSTIGHDVQIGNHCHLGTNTIVGGGAEIGDLSTIHPGAIILPRVKIEDNCVIGAGAVAIKRIPSHSSVYGNPAKRLTF